MKNLEKENLKLKQQVQALKLELSRAYGYYVGDHRLGGQEHKNQELVRWKKLINS